MEISFDKKADAIYIKFRKGEFGSNKKIDENTIMDLDRDANLLGIEFLSASKRIPPKGSGKGKRKGSGIVACA